jgi:hypothetical protein
MHHKEILFIRVFSPFIVKTTSVNGKDSMQHQPLFQQAHQDYPQ